MEIETVPNAAPESAPASEPQSAPAANTETSTASPAEKHEEQPTPQEQRHKIKFGKNERELTIDELRMYAQKGWASDDRFQQAARMRKEVEEALKQANYDKLIEKSTGKPALEFYKEKLKAEIRKMQMTPEQKEEAELKQRLESLKQQEQEIYTKRQQEQLEQQERHYTETWDRELTEAIAKEGLPKTKYAVQRAVQIASGVVKAGLDPDWTLVVREAKRQVQDDIKGLIEAMKDDNALVGIFGDENSQRISKALVNRKNPVAAKEVMAKNAVKGDNFRQKEPTMVDVDDWIAARRKAFESK